MELIRLLLEVTENTLPEKGLCRVISLEKLSAGHEPDENHTTSLQMALKRYCLALTQSPWEAEDLAQDTWVKALGYMKTSKHSKLKSDRNDTSQINNNSEHTSRTNFSPLTNHPNPEALLLRIARNTWTDIIRRKATLSRVLEMDQPRTEEAAGYGLFEIEAAFQALQKHLSPLQQAVFLLRDVFEHSGSEAAEILDTTEGAIKAALHRARQALPAVRQELLQSNGPSILQDTELQIALNRLASAYEQGQIPELIELVLADESQETVMAVSSQSFQSFQSVQPFQSGGFSSMGWNYSEPGMRMVA
ncbi:RNA polymerase sigma factor [Paenibacillus sp. B2(2019)]|uniref:RNA polymerase sigma factor n=1 Tax=Paenibacillus sp. B2(2019) TaxID=2607754 RepID=UPI001CB75148|nr:RNA polymerase sigma factor [Paenibacillus sp. B2(2019)]